MPIETVNHPMLKGREKERGWEWERGCKYKIAVMSKTLNKAEQISHQKAIQKSTSWISITHQPLPLLFLAFY